MVEFVGGRDGVVVVGEVVVCEVGFGDLVEDEAELGQSVSGWGIFIALVGGAYHVVHEIFAHAWEVDQALDAVLLEMLFRAEA